MPKPPLGIFSADVFAVLNENTNQVREHLSGQAGTSPKTLPELIDTAKEVAVDLVLRRSLEDAKYYFFRDPVGSLAVDTLVNKLVSEENVFATIKRAHASMQHSVSILPCQAFAAFLIELCASLRVVTDGGRLAEPELG